MWILTPICNAESFCSLDFSAKPFGVCLLNSVGSMKSKEEMKPVGDVNNTRRKENKIERRKQAWATHRTWQKSRDKKIRRRGRGVREGENQRIKRICSGRAGGEDIRTRPSHPARPFLPITARPSPD